MMSEPILDSTGCTSGGRERQHGEAPMAYRERIGGRAGRSSRCIPGSRPRSTGRSEVQLA
jgi:hypothetical protein